MGLMQEVAEPDALFDTALAMAQRVAAQAPLAVQASRSSARIAVEEGPAAAFANLMEQARSLMHTDDAREGMMSFMERRDARFTGK